MNLYGPKQLIDSIRTVRKNTIQIAEDIPKRDYGYRGRFNDHDVMVVKANGECLPAHSPSGIILQLPERGMADCSASWMILNASV